jgi:hypothetical protein
LKLDLIHTILNNESKEIAERDMSVERCKTTMTILIGGYRYYFYDSHDEANHDFEIIERFVRLKNILD